MPNVNAGHQGHPQSNVPASINAQNVVGAAHQVNNGEVPSATELLNTSPNNLQMNGNNGQGHGHGHHNNMQANAANMNFTNPGQLNKAVTKTGEDCCCAIM